MRVKILENGDELFPYPFDDGMFSHVETVDVPDDIYNRWIAALADYSQAQKEMKALIES